MNITSKNSVITNGDLAGIHSRSQDVDPCQLFISNTGETSVYLTQGEQDDFGDLVSIALPSGVLSNRAAVEASFELAPGQNIKMDLPASPNPMTWPNDVIFAFTLSEEASISILKLVV